MIGPPLKTLSMHLSSDPVEHLLDYSVKTPKKDAEGSQFFQFGIETYPKETDSSA